MDEEEKQAWRQHAKEMERMREKRRWQFKEVIRELVRMGFEVKEVSPFQYRINEAIDIYPSNKKYHDLVKNKRGDIRGQNFSDFIRNYFNIKTA